MRRDAISLGRAHGGAMAQPRLATLCLALFLALFLGLWAAPAAAQVCCPSGCVQDGAGCVRTGPTPAACGRVPCGTSAPPQAGSRHPRGGSAVSHPRQPTRSRVCKLDNQLPPGSFTQTCPQVNYRCNVDEDKLTAICKARNGELRKSRLQGASTCANVENIDGRLKCTRQRRYVAD